jgi:hypothetical protein
MPTRTLTSTPRWEKIFAQPSFSIQVVRRSRAAGIE